MRGWGRDKRARGSFHPFFGTVATVHEQGCGGVVGGGVGGVGVGGGVGGGGVGGGGVGGGGVGGRIGGGRGLMFSDVGSEIFK